MHNASATSLKHIDNYIIKRIHYTVVTVLTFEMFDSTLKCQILDLAELRIFTYKAFHQSFFDYIWVNCPV